MLLSVVHAEYLLINIMPSVQQKHERYNKKVSPIRSECVAISLAFDLITQQYCTKRNPFPIN